MLLVIDSGTGGACLIEVFIRFIESRVSLAIAVIRRQDELIFIKVTALGEAHIPNTMRDEADSEKKSPVRQSSAHRGFRLS